MDSGKIFSAEVAPSLILMDVLGRRNPVVTAEHALFALDYANKLHGLGGKGIAKRVDDDSGVLDYRGMFILHYRSRAGRATKSEIARVARIIASSQIRRNDWPVAGETLFVTGSRALVYPEIAAVGASTVPFLVSTSIWYNHNRVTEAFPSTKAQEQMLLEDINSRLDDGEVSVHRQ